MRCSPCLAIDILQTITRIKLRSLVVFLRNRLAVIVAKRMPWFPLLAATTRVLVEICNIRQKQYKHLHHYHYFDAFVQALSHQTDEIQNGVHYETWNIWRSKCKGINRFWCLFVTQYVQYSLIFNLRHQSSVLACYNGSNRCKMMHWGPWFCKCMTLTKNWIENFKIKCKSPHLEQQFDTTNIAVAGSID